jgi:hypothetical protein
MALWRCRQRLYFSIVDMISAESPGYCDLRQLLHRQSEGLWATSYERVRTAGPDWLGFGMHYKMREEPPNLGAATAVGCRVEFSGTNALDSAAAEL